MRTNVYMRPVELDKRSIKKMDGWMNYKALYMPSLSSMQKVYGKCTARDGTVFP